MICAISDSISFSAHRATVMSLVDALSGCSGFRRSFKISPSDLLVGVHSLQIFLLEIPPKLIVMQYLVLSPVSQPLG